ncbi:hypothetical protein GJV85_00265 [Sulfurimonas aquatica]|uniref:Cadherin domain-containing protein n=1 Tax=Sulfurimonas aquatica TaxID=2672570 RepID=A0A975AY41_9BACT|nr:cadherin domain-containing protein [Sulfurimonas aquatica]QSZ40615.1 hypothetical protein GJV85_00265 [Sulfurimonas aquatica]
MIKLTSLYILILSVFTGCGNIEQTKSNIDTNGSIETNATVASTVTGRFLDDYVQGLSYLCSSSSDINLTNGSGEFTCLEDDNVTLSLGSYSFSPFMIQNATLTPYTLFTKDVKASLNLARLIQSIDSDNLTTNGIIVLDKTKEALIPNDINFSSPNFEADIEAALSITLVSANSAQTNMNAAIVTAGLSVPAEFSVVPLAKIVTDLNATTNGVVKLDGSSSIASSYLWRLVEPLPLGSTTSIINPTAQNASFLADVNGTYIVELVVNEGDLNSISQRVEIVVSNDMTSALNSAPVISPTLNDVLEVYENTLMVVDVNASDVDGDTLSYFISGSDSGSFYMDVKTGVLRFKVKPNYELKNSYRVTVLVDDGNSVNSQASKDININVKNIVEVPSLANTSLNIDENASIGALAGSVTILDQGDSNISSLTLYGEGGESFKIDSSGNIKTATALDYETKVSYTLFAYATSSTGKSATVSVNIKINNSTDTKPTIVNTALTILEDAKSEALVGSLTISDYGDTSISDISFSSPSSEFTIDTNGTIRVSSSAVLDYETTQEYNLTVRAINSAGSSNGAIITIYINNVIDEVAVLVDSNANIDENAMAGTYVGDINITYMGDSNITSIALSGSGSENFQAAVDGRVSLKSGASLDYEKVNSYELIAVATNMKGKSNSALFKIALNDIPEVAILNDFVGSIKENKITGATIGTMEILYGGDTSITEIKLSGSGNENFIVNATGLMSLNAGSTLDYETTKVYNLKAVATNTAGNSAEVDVTISVEDYAFRPFQIAKLQASDAEKNDNFGTTVAVSGEYVVVGAPYEDADGISNAGSAYVYKKDENGSLGQVQKLQATTPSADDNFGRSVAISENFIVVGAPNEDTTATNAGSVYLYERLSNGTISFISQYQASNASASSNFGSSLAMDGSYFVVGAPKEDTLSENSGTAYLFQISGSVATQRAILRANSPAFKDNFGSSVAIDGDYVVVGAHLSDTIASDDGSVYVFKIASNSTVGTPKKITASDREDSDYFGSAVSVSGSYILVGAPSEDSQGSNAGSAYLYKIQSDESISELEKVQIADIESGDYFGNSVALNGQYFVVGAYKQDSLARESGSAYVYEINSGDSVSQRFKLKANDKEADDMFASSLAFSGDYIAVGALGEDTIASNAGSVYLFDTEAVDRIYLYNSNSVNIYEDEEQKRVLFSVDALSPNGSLFYSLGGDDFDSFERNGTDISNLIKFDYEMPLDVGANNSYSVTVGLSDTLGNSASLSRVVNVNDLYYLELAQQLASDPSLDDRYGESVSISGDIIVVGAPYDDDTATDAGSIYIYRKNSDKSLSFVDKIQAATPENGAYFGTSVSIDGAYIAVGTLKEKAYLFKINSSYVVSPIASPTISDGTLGDMFGAKVALSGNYLTLSAHEQNSSTGSVYVYKIINDTNTSLIGKISASNSASGDKFGSTISIDGSYILVGAAEKNTQSGSAYLFKIQSDTLVTELASIVSSDIALGDRFASSVSISGSYIAIGASHSDATALDSGSAYIFKIASDDSVSELQKLEFASASPNQHFGVSISIDSDHIVVGESSTEESKNVYVYKINSDTNITQVETISAKNSSVSSNYGVSVDIDADNIVVGANKESSTIVDAGAIYLYEKD